MRRHLLHTNSKSTIERQSIFKANSFIFFLFFLTFSTYVFGNITPISLDALSNEGISLNDHIGVYKSNNDQLVIEKIARLDADSFVLVQDRSSLKEKGKSWLKFEIENPFDKTIKLIVFHNKAHPALLYYQQNGEWISEDLSYLIKHQEYNIYGMENDFFQCVIPAQEIKQFYIKTSESEPIFRFEIFPFEAGWNKVYQQVNDDVISYMLRASFLGIFLFFSIFIFLQYLQHKDKSYLYYSLFLFLIFIAYTFRFGRFFYTPLSPLLENWLGYFSGSGLYLYTLVYLLFFKSFLDENERSEKILFNITKYLIISLGLFTIIDVVLNIFELFYWRDFMYECVRVLMGLILLYIPWFSFRTKKRTFTYLGLGSLMITFFALMTTMVTEDPWLQKTFLTSVPLNKFWTIKIAPIHIGFLLEIFFFALALGHRTKLIEKERQKVIREKATQEVELKLVEAEKKEAIRLQELEITKSKLYTKITHEFRSPLSVIDFHAREILKAPDLKEELINGIIKSSDELRSFVDDMLDLAKLESGNFNLTTNQDDIIKTIELLNQSFQSQAISKKIALSFHSSIDELRIDYSKKGIWQIMSNLISNALKFTPEGGQVFIKLKTDNDKKVILSVENTGRGIEASEISKIFDPFYQAANEKRGDEKGTGLGLSIVKQLVQLMQGTIEAESKINNKTTFTINLPITRTAPVCSLPQEAENFIVNPDIKSVSPIQISNATRELHKVLVVEDNYYISNHLCRLLSKNYSVIVAYNGKEGLEKAQEENPDIIISDEMMPIMSGFEMLKKLKSNTKLQHIPVIMLTSRASEESELEGYENKVDNYFKKPLGENGEKTLKEAIKTLLEKEKLISDDLTNWKKGITDKFTLTTLSILEEKYKDENFRRTNLLFSLRKEGYGEREANKLIKKHLKTTPAELIKSYRLDHSKKLLVNPKLSIPQIIEEVGLTCDQASFTHMYKSKFGKTPRGYYK